MVIARVVIFQVDAHHSKFDRVPSGDDVQAKTPVPDMIGGDHLLCSEDRIDKSHMQRAEYRDFFCERKKTTRPRESLESGSLRVALALVAMPTPDGQ